MLCISNILKSKKYLIICLLDTVFKLLNYTSEKDRNIEHSYLIKYEY